MFGPCVDYSSSEVGHVYALWQPYLFKGIWQYGELQFAKYI